MARLASSLFALFTLLPGCFDSHGTIPGADAGARPDARTLALDTGAGPAHCGETVCGASEYCCSAACSFCAPVGSSCPDIDCAPSCTAQDARGEGDCEIARGWAWNGNACLRVSGCECIGADCGSLFPSEASCTARYAHCPSGAACGGRTGLLCPPDQFCDYEDDSCGAFDSTGTCRPRPTECLEPGGVPVCGCDGVEYWADCPANMGGVDRRNFGACSAGTGMRAARALPTCAPFDGPAWELTFTATSGACTDGTGPSLVVELWTDLNTAPPHVYSVGGGVTEGAARFCSVGGPCQTLTGEVTVDFFATGEVARVGYALTAPDGTSYVESDIELTQWCGFSFPGCG